MEVCKAEHKGCDSYKVTGRINSLTSPQLAEAVAQSMNDGRFRLILDLSAVDYISSAGLRVLIDIQKKCKHSGRGELVLSGVQKRVFDMLEIAGFIPLFRLFNDVDASVASLSTPEKAESAELRHTHPHAGSDEPALCQYPAHIPNIHQDLDNRLIDPGEGVGSTAGEVECRERRGGILTMTGACTKPITRKGFRSGSQGVPESSIFASNTIPAGAQQSCFRP